MGLVILNLDSARFECTFDRGCDGVCCRNGRPPIYPDEAGRIDAALGDLLPVMRPEARAAAGRSGYLSRRRKAGQPVLRVVQGWCIFFNRGCVLQRAGIKPGICAIFPLAKDERDRWYVRQKGYKGEIWELPCLDAGLAAPPAAESLKDEIALLEAWLRTPE